MAFLVLKYKYLVLLQLTLNKKYNYFSVKLRKNKYGSCGILKQKKINDDLEVRFSISYDVDDSLNTLHLCTYSIHTCSSPMYSIHICFSLCTVYIHALILWTVYIHVLSLCTVYIHFLSLCTVYIDILTYYMSIIHTHSFFFIALFLFFFYTITSIFLCLILYFSCL